MDEADNRQAPLNPFQYRIAWLVVGWSAHGAIPREVRRRDGFEIRDTDPEKSANLDFAVGNELIGRDCQVGRRRSLADTARRVVLRAVAGAKEAVIIALMGDRDAAEMGA